MARRKRPRNIVWAEGRERKLPVELEELARAIAQHPHAFDGPFLSWLLSRLEMEPPEALEFLMIAQHNAAFIGAERAFDFEDSDAITWGVTDVPGDRVIITASAAGGSGGPTLGEIEFVRDQFEYWYGLGDGVNVTGVKNIRNYGTAGTPSNGDYTQADAGAGQDVGHTSGASLGYRAERDIKSAFFPFRPEDGTRTTEFPRVDCPISTIHTQSFTIHCRFNCTGPAAFATSGPDTFTLDSAILGYRLSDTGIWLWIDHSVGSELSQVGTIRDLVFTVSTSGGDHNLALGSITFGQTYDVIITWNASTNTLSGYLNGALIASEVVTNPSWNKPEIHVGAVNLKGGGLGTNFRCFYGNIDEFGWLTRAITGAEASTLHGGTNVAELPEDAERGDMAFFNGTNWRRVPLGGIGEVLTINEGPDGYLIPTWVQP